MEQEIVGESAVDGSGSEVKEQDQACDTVMKLRAKVCRMFSWSGYDSYVITYSYYPHL